MLRSLRRTPEAKTFPAKMLKVGWTVQPLPTAKHDKIVFSGEFVGTCFSILYKDHVAQVPIPEPLKPGDVVGCHFNDGNVFVSINGSLLATKTVCAEVALWTPSCEARGMSVNVVTQVEELRFLPPQPTPVRALGSECCVSVFEADALLTRCPLDTLLLSDTEVPPLQSQGLYRQLADVFNRFKIATLDDCTDDHITKVLDHTAAAELARVPLVRAYARILVNLNHVLMHVFPLVDFSNPQMRLVKAWLSFKDVLLDPVCRSLFKSQMAQVVKKHHVTHQVKIHLYVTRLRHDMASALRQSVFGQLYSQLRSVGTTFCYATQLFHVELVGLGSADHGGPCRQVLSELAREIMEKHSTAPFQCNPLFFRVNPEENSLIMPSPHTVAPEHLDMYRFFGRLLGAFLITEAILAVDFPSLFWKYISHGEGSYVTYHDWAQVTPTVGRILAQIEKAEISDDSVADLCEEYSTEIKKLQGDSNVALSPSARAVLLNRIMMRPWEVQLRTIHEGMTEVIPARVLCALPWREMSTTVCGSPAITYDDLKVNTQDELGEMSAMFWLVVGNMTDQQRSLLLEFATGQKRLPLPATKKLKVVTSSSRSDQTLPTAGTCGFTLKIPFYSSEGVLRDRLVYAIENGNTAIDADALPQQRIVLE